MGHEYLFNDTAKTASTERLGRDAALREVRPGDTLSGSESRLTEQQREYEEEGRETKGSRV
jgi:hypothetical protein